MRVAIYFAPSADAKLALRGAEWLGRDTENGMPRRQPAIVGIDPERQSALTADARRYGFHATLKAPFALREETSIDRLAAALDRFATQRAPFPIDLAVARIGGFLALVPAGPSPSLDRLAADCVVEFDDFRAPPTAEDLARRRQSGLTQRQDELLVRYGYPYVLDEFRFHMTLTARVAGEEGDRIAAAAEAHFAVAVAAPVTISSVALFQEPEPGAAFTILSRHELAGTLRLPT